MSVARTFSLRARLASLRPAARGLGALLRSEHNAWIHAAATVLVAATALGLRCTATEGALLALAISLVWAAEAANTALERLADCVTAEPHPGIGAAKDLAAGAVLAASLGAVAVGGLVLGPHLLGLLGLR
jgi:diacylglycerol kinase (ATP)